MVVTELQYVINVSNEYIASLKHEQCYLSVISQL